MDTLSDALMLLTHELEVDDTKLLLSPFEVIRYAHDHDELREKLIMTLQNISDLGKLGLSAADCYDALISPVLQSDEPFPLEALHLFQPLLVLVHQSFGCYKVLRDCQHYASERTGIADEVLEELGIVKELARSLPCLNAEYQLKFEHSSFPNPNIIGLALVSFECPHRRRLRKLQERFGIVKKAEDE